VRFRSREFLIKEYFLVMTQKKFAFGIITVSAIAVLAYLGAVAYAGKQVDQRLDQLRGSLPEQQTNGMVGIIDLKVSSGFFERHGTADVVLAAPMHQPIVLPVTFSIMQAPSIDSAVRITFQLDAPSDNSQLRAVTALGGPHALHGVFQQGYGGSQRVMLDSYPLQGEFQQVQIKWGGVHVDLTRSGNTADMGVQANARVDPLQLTNSAAGRTLNTGVMNLSAQITGDNSRGSIQETFSIDESAVVENGKKVFAINEGDMHLESAWDLVDPQNPGFRIKKLTIQMDSQKPIGAVALHADAVIPMSKEKLASIQAENDPTTLPGLFRQIVAHTSLSIPKALLAQNPVLAGIAAQYGKEEGDTVQINATAQNGRIIVNGQYIL
jgi:hypothetical protein